MDVKLIGYTKSVIEDIDTPKDLIAFCARVSNPSNQMNKETSDKLISYLIKHAHWSPFEMAQIVLEINTTRDIGRQILRHRSFSFQEFSQRYANIEDMDDSFVIREARLQDTKNRQNSLESKNTELASWWDAQQKFIIEHSKRIYREALKKGIAKEVARAVLPEGNTKSRMYMSGSIRSWIHYIQLRSENGTQKEHREIALACAEAIREIFDVNTY